MKRREERGQFDPEDQVFITVIDKCSGKGVKGEKVEKVRRSR